MNVKYRHVRHGRKKSPTSYLLQLASGHSIMGYYYKDTLRNHWQALWWSERYICRYGGISLRKPHWLQSWVTTRTCNKSLCVQGKDILNIHSMSTWMTYSILVQLYEFAELFCCITILMGRLAGNKSAPSTFVWRFRPGRVWHCDSDIVTRTLWLGCQQLCGYISSCISPEASESTVLGHRRLYSTPSRPPPTT